jgi:hypothetical protein
VAQHDYVIANGTGAAVRSDLNNGLAAIVSQNSGATEPATMYAYQWWADTTTGLLKIRNSANNAWVTVGTLASANLGLAALASPTFTGTVTAPTFTASTAVNIPLGSAGSPTLFFTGDSNTGLFSPGADAIALATAGTNRLHITSGGLVGIGTTTVDYKLDVNGSAQIRAGESLYFQNAAANGRASIQCAGAGTNTDLTINTAGSERCRVDGSGRLLVGTSTAQGGAKLQVQDGEVFLRRSHQMLPSTPLVLTWDLWTLGTRMAELAPKYLLNRMQRGEQVTTQADLCSPLRGTANHHQLRRSEFLTLAILRLLQHHQRMPLICVLEQRREPQTIYTGESMALLAFQSVGRFLFKYLLTAMFKTPTTATPQSPTSS